MPDPVLVRRRRLAVALLTGSTSCGVVAWMAWLLGADGLGAADAAMLVLFGLTVPNASLAFWNGVLGFAALRRSTRFVHEPLRGRTARKVEATRTAIVVPVCDEAPGQVFAHLHAMVEALDAAAAPLDFEVFILSDSRDEDVAAEEEARFAAWLTADPAPARLHYRRRADNRGFKAGNIWDFCERQGGDFDFMVVLDADSLMTAAAIDRLVRTMAASPRAGIIQPLIVGLPATSPFARVFQFGMRLGMRTYAAGSAWWQADEGAFWGHNAIVRLAPFREHCALPELPGTPPLGGSILSHDQVEAVLMRRGGFDVRVVPVEDGSFERNPPTLADFLKRDLRWCQGNMQYLRLLAMPGVRLVGRLQLVLAIMMYLASPLWLGFITLGIARAGTSTGELFYAMDPSWAIGLLAVMIGMSFMPKTLGLLDALLDPARRQAFGGGLRLVAGFALELVFSILLAPVVALAHSIFLGGLLFGRTVRWQRQERDERTIGWLEAARGLWPQTLAGIAATAVLAAEAPVVLPWAAPFLAGLVLAVPFARLSSSPALGRILARLRLCATAEEGAPPFEIRALGVPRLEAPAAVAAPAPAYRPARRASLGSGTSRA